MTPENITAALAEIDRLRALRINFEGSISTSDTSSLMSLADSLCTALQAAQAQIITLATGLVECFDVTIPQASRCRLRH